MCATTDQSTGIQWAPGFEDRSAYADYIGGGYLNTKLIFVRYLIWESYAVLTCNEYNGGGHNDWYMPSRYELNLMYLNLHLAGIGDFTNGLYWSSTEESTNDAWYQNFDNGGMYTYPKSGNAGRVRAIRAF
jgi:hypothetical protein